jgi:transposase-like protein
MSKKRRQYSEKYKFQIRGPSGWEAAKGQKTMNELASEHSLHPTQIREWKQKLLAEGPSVFSRDNSRRDQEQAAQEVGLYEQIGRLKMELHPRGPRLKKKAAPFA